MTTAQFGSYISADSHVTEPPEAYAQIDAAFRDRAPRLEHLPGMGATIVIDPGGEGEAFVPFGRIAAAGRTHIDRPDGWRWDELHRGGYDAVARIIEQTADGFAAEVMFPSVGMVLCSHPDLAYKRACFRAYNRWIAEFCAESPSRLLGVGQSAVGTPEEGIADLSAIKALGLRGVMLPGFPGVEDYNHEMYQPFWDAVVESGLPVSFHILSSGEGRRWRGPGMNGFLGIFHANQDLLGTLIFGGVFERHPGLHVVSVEADAGWVPHFAMRMDTLYRRHQKWVETAGLSKPPSEYFHENVYFTFQDDVVALQMLDLINVDRLMWANDHPHSDATWPESAKIHSAFAELVAPDKLDRIVRDNCAELYGIAV
jgi:predicted TIM-barrel fold metal-dependent hydrolase